MQERIFIAGKSIVMKEIKAHIHNKKKYISQNSDVYGRRYIESIQRAELIKNDYQQSIRVSKICKQTFQSVSKHFPGSRQGDVE